MSKLRVARLKDITAVQCFKCHEATKKDTIRGVRVDRCTTCGGIWLDEGELECLTTGQYSTRRMLLREARERTVSSIAMHTCPKCAARLNPMIIGHGLELDVCNNCNGIGFDAGELKYYLSLNSGKIKRSWYQKLKDWLISKK